MTPEPPNPLYPPKKPLNSLELVDVSSRNSPVAGFRGLIRSGLASCAKHGYSAFRNSLPQSIASMTRLPADRRKASERIIQSLSVPY